MDRVIAFIVLAAAFPVIIAAQNTGNSVPKGGAGDKCDLNTTEFQGLRAVLKTCFGDIVEFARTGVENHNCNSVTDLKDKITLYFDYVNETCGNIRTTPMKDLTFLKLLDTTKTHNESFTKFYDNLKCIQNIERNLTERTQHYVIGWNNTRIHNRWFPKFNLHPKNEQSCNRMKNVRKDVLNLLQTNCPETVDYVSVLYNITLEGCNTTEVAQTPQQSPSSSISLNNFLPITVTIVIFQYLLTLRSSKV